MWSALGEWLKNLFQGKGNVQVGKGNPSVSGVTMGDVGGPVVVGNGNVLHTYQHSQDLDLNPTD